MVEQAGVEPTADVVAGVETADEAAKLVHAMQRLREATGNPAGQAAMVETAAQVATVAVAETVAPSRSWQKKADQCPRWSLPAAAAEAEEEVSAASQEPGDLVATAGYTARVATATRDWSPASMIIAKADQVSTAGRATQGHRDYLVWSAATAFGVVLAERQVASLPPSSSKTCLESDTRRTTRASEHQKKGFSIPAQSKLLFSFLITPPIFSLVSYRAPSAVGVGQ
ncbi:hypothetical protein [Mesorhizobium sp. M8A.F.Ca.ET.207.01.1.1]|uniref:hypothetical protein n=1 Tax=Mesorhizobium sp. M8A.F.Ca.ET.207.01.1.1 TaxID=2563968 RepID=UPI001678CF55|nr:hypothetical protein [Mesorhizobium sp. M8A.F.Ca.ET.207.01.1.1]